MCFIFHKWEKWSEVRVKQEKVKRPRDMDSLLDEPDYDYYLKVESFQERFCERCGKYQKRVIEYRFYS